jgi:guanosine-3',5'-bis(diphosphate) 3'-pyrophosphohydrolase
LRQWKLLEFVALKTGALKPCLFFLPKPDTISTKGARMDITAKNIRSNWDQKLLSQHLPQPTKTEKWWDEAQEARELAKDAHEGQFRKGTNEPYFLHLAEVAMIIGGFAEQNLLTPEEYKIAIASAWLHDTVEDCGIELSKINKLFGQEVAEVVDALTKNKKSQLIMDPMTDSLFRIELCGKVASIVKTADRISNLSWTPPESWTSKKIRRYGQEGRHIAATLCGQLPHEVALALELVSDAYLKQFGALGHPAQPPRPIKR